MPFKSTSIPSVKIANKSSPPATVRLKGWLNKQKHGKCKAWLRRYFVLYDKELRYYKNKNDTNALAVISLDHYSIVPNAQPLTSLNQKQWRFHTFCLVSDDDTKFDWPDYFLQAENPIERKEWVNNLQIHVAQSQSVLEKWLERLDMPAEDISVMTSVYNQGDKSSHKSSPALPPSQEQLSLSSNINLPPLQNSLRTHKSSESLVTFSTQSSIISISGESSKRRPSDFSSSRSTEITSKLLSSKIFNWTRTKSSSSSINSSSNSLNNVIIENISNDLLTIPQNTPIKPIESPIIHPSEYNHDDDPIDRLNASRQNYKSIDIDPTTGFFYVQQQNMH